LAASKLAYHTKNEDIAYPPELANIDTKVFKFKIYMSYNVSQFLRKLIHKQHCNRLGV